MLREERLERTDPLVIDAVEMLVKETPLVCERKAGRGEASVLLETWEDIAPLSLGA